LACGLSKFFHARQIIGHSPLAVDHNINIQSSIFDIQYSIQEALKALCTFLAMAERLRKMHDPALVVVPGFPASMRNACT
jgi:hypothetical protein